MKERGLAWSTLLAAGSLCAALSAPAHSAIITYNFEAYDDGAVVTTLPGVSLSNAMVLRSGMSLNEIGFPPKSGAAVIIDDGAPIALSFASGVYSVAGYFNYTSGLRLDAYDSADQLLGTVFSSYLANLADGSGDPGSLPNELLSFGTGSPLIAKVVLSGDPAGYSFTLDDLTIVTADRQGVPEPGSWALLALGAACLVGSRLRWRG
ncbi:PEP-CTERM sorting domain-containing protein [Massilia arenosa]|uniref:PEP-CTERM sorting domain-containing protein n=1 Tax=Zemynaea arenosa TaxID=2561931 RepID=A0A4Y9SJF7_9BURK|nr:PEP-CTERM sorting domain-containing protein [Massilia arenosa]TFW26270.1 PEP-CTERM sorting domain-containing protein [Massilia arenosa]